MYLLQGHSYGLAMKRQCMPHNSLNSISSVHYVILRDVFAQIDLGMEIANLGVE